MLPLLVFFGRCLISWRGHGDTVWYANHRRVKHFSCCRRVGAKRRCEAAFPSQPVVGQFEFAAGRNPLDGAWPACHV